jgi:hypothetical protein
MSYKRSLDDDESTHYLKKQRKKSPPSTPSTMKRKIRIFSMELDLHNENKQYYSIEEVNKIVEEALKKQREEFELIMEKKLEEQLFNINNYYLLHNSCNYNGKECSYIT